MKFNKSFGKNIIKSPKNLLPVTFTELPKTDVNNWTTRYHLPREKQDIGKWRETIREFEMPYIPQRVKIQVLFRDTVLNGHVKACMRKRKSLTMLKEFSLQDAKGKQNEEWTKYFNAKWFKLIQEYILDAQAYGYTFINWTAVKNNVIDNIHIVRREFLSPDRRTIAYYPYAIDGKSYDDEDIQDWTMYVDTPSEHGISPAGYGYLFEVACYEIYLRNLLGQNATFVELFGQPIRIGKTPQTDEDERKEFFNALVNMGASAAIVMDLQEEITLVESKNVGTSFMTYANLEERCEKKISKLILGHADALDSTAGKLGSAQGDENPIAQSLYATETNDSIFVETYVNDVLIPKLRSLGINIPLDLTFKFLNNKEEQEQERHSMAIAVEFATFCKTMSDAGYEIDPKDIEAKTTFKVKKKAMPTAGGGSMGKPSLPL